MSEGPVLANEAALKDLAHAILDHLRPRCAYADLLYEGIAKTEVNLLSGGEALAKAYSGKAAIQTRLLGKDGRHVEISLGVCPFEELKADLDGALKLLDTVEADPGYGLADVPNPQRHRYGIDLVKDIRQYDAATDLFAMVEDIQAIALELTTACAARGHSVRIVPEIWAYSQVEEKLVMDVLGLFKTQLLPATFVQVFVRAREGDRLAQTRVRFGDIRELATFMDDGHLKEEYRALVRQWMEQAVSLLDAKRLLPEEIDRLTHIVLAPSAMVFVHEAQGHNFEADIIQRNGSGLFDEQGRPAIDPLGAAVCDLYDGPPCDAEGNVIEGRGFGTHFIDDEGVELQRVRLVHRGRIAGRLNNRATAHFYGEEPNGHGYSELGNIRVVRMTNTYLFPADRAAWRENVEELIAGVPRGVLLEGSLGGAVSKDGMSTSIQYGRRIIDGKLGSELLPAMNLTVKTLGALEKVEGFAGEPQVDGLGFCGKEGQTKPVTDGGFYLRIATSPAITLGY